MGGVWLTDGRELKAVTGVDNYSRFCVSAGLVERANPMPCAVSSPMHWSATAALKSCCPEQPAPPALIMGRAGHVPIQAGSRGVAASTVALQGATSVREATQPERPSAREPTRVEETLLKA
jgi:hypothetical protein